MSSDYEEFINRGPRSPQRHPEHEKFEMYVPDRILVAGQDRFIGTTAPPRELRLENSIRPPDPSMIRVETPPRIITMSEHRFPTVGEDEDSSELESLPSSPANGSIMVTPKKNKAFVPVNDSAWDSITALNETNAQGVQPGEEVNHLRRQMAKLNRRLMALELESMQRQQRDKWLLATGLSYFLVKFLFWLNK